MERDLRSFSEAYLNNASEEFVVVTVTAIKGSAPQNLGAKMMVSQGQILFGTVGGGKIEAHCISFARKMLENKESVISCSWNLQKDIGMTCGGEMSFLFEKSQSTKWNIAIMGAGHVSQALTRTLLNLDCNLFVFDTRSEWLDKLPEDRKLKKLCLEKLSDSLDMIPEDSFICSMTMGHAHDVPILKRALEEFNFPYYGVIGSKAKRNAILKDLGRKEANFFCPMRLKFGTKDPFEIALSISAQLIKVRDQIHD